MKPILFIARDRRSEPPASDGDLVAQPHEDETWVVSDGRTLDSAALVELIFDIDHVVVW
jgi:hypothetical protein